MSALPREVAAPAPQPAQFVHLNLHTEFSLVDSVIRIGQLVDAVRDRGMPAVAVTDFSNLFALVKFFRSATAAGIKPIIGAEVSLAASRELPAGTMTLLVRNLPGYQNLCHLLSESYLSGQHNGIPHIQWDWLQGHGAGLIALSGADAGPLVAALASGRDKAIALARHCQALFPDAYYVELQRTGREGQQARVDAALDVASECALPVVATNAVRFLNPEDFEVHEARVCIQQGSTLADPRRARNYAATQYLRSAAEMAELFSDLPEALDNSVAIAQRCNFALELGQSHLPDFSPPDGSGVDDYLIAQARAGMQRELAGSRRFEARREEYEARLNSELDTIAAMGFSGYFLIVADFIRWARQNGIPVGPGRGSGAGSLVAFALGITRLDPIEHDLLFERFLNPERVSLPDFDVDFCMERRDQVIDYVAHRYGRERVSQIITYGTMAAKAVVRDAGRVLGMPYGFVDSVAKLVPFEIGMTLEKALTEGSELQQRYRDEDDVRELIDLARSLEGLARNAGKHAGGVVIAPQPLTAFAPLFCESRGGSAVTQFDKDDAEAIGLVKFDFLGLRTLTIIDWAVTMIRQMVPDQAELDIDAIAMDEPRAFQLLQSGETTAIFQLESRGIRDLIRRLKPDCFEDIVALVALYRPGPLQSGMVDDFIARKQGNATIDYLEPRLEPVLKGTYGVILYQEQVMQIAQVLAGYSLGQADLLRRAMGKKKPEEMARQREVFLAGARERDVPDEKAVEIFDLMEKFAGYGFNKSHSAAYALVSYQTAWLKALYPAQFMAAVLSADLDNTDKLIGLVGECRRLGLEVLPPDINRSEYRFTVEPAGGIRYGLGALKGVGAGVVEHIIERRAEHGPFNDLLDLCQSLDLQRINRRALEALVKAGAFDTLEAQREQLLAALPRTLEMAARHSRDAAAGQTDLFGSPRQQPEQSLRPVRVPKWSGLEKLAAEHEALGLFLSGHPMTSYRRDLAGLVDHSLAELGGRIGQRVRAAGLVVAVRVVSRRNIVFLTLEDETASLEVTLSDGVYTQCREAVVKNAPVVVAGAVETDRYTGGCKLVAEGAWSPAQARGQFANGLELRLDVGRMCASTVDRLGALLDASRGGECAVRFTICNGQAEAPLRTEQGWRVFVNDALLHDLRALDGVQVANVRYATCLPRAADGINGGGK